MRRRRYDPEIFTWFKCPCGAEAAGDPTSVENIYYQHEISCTMSRRVLGDMQDMAELAAKSA